VLEGLMQETPLLISSLIEHAAKYHGRREIVTLAVEGGVHRTNWSEIGLRSKRMANALLKDLKVKPGDRIATLASCPTRDLIAF
jgi:fatty-acyl-CoA synthase